MSAHRLASVLRRVLPVLLLGACTSEPPAQQRHALSSTTPIGGDLRLSSAGTVPTYGGVQWIALASGSGVHLSVWNHSSLSYAAAARVRSSDGVLLDAASIRLTKGTDPCGTVVGRPAVAHAKGTFLVVWPTFYSICGVRIRADGTVLDSPALVLARSKNLDAPAVATDGTDFFVAWGDGRVDPSSSSGPGQAVDIYGTRVRSSDGASLDGDGFAIASSIWTERTPELAFDGTNFLVLWAQPMGLHAARVRASDRQLLDATPIRLDSGTGRPAALFDGTNFLVVWMVGPEIRSRHLRSDGTLVEPDMAVTHVGPNGGVKPALASDGTNLLVVWRGTKLNALRLDKNGAAIGSLVVLDAAAGADDWTDQALTFADGHYFAAWDRSLDVQNDELNNHQAQVRGARVDPATATAAADFSLANAAPTQRYPMVSFDGQLHLLVWHEFDGTRFQVRGARLRDADGALLDPGGFDISGSGAKNQLYGHTASNGSNHLVLWWDGKNLRARRVRGSDGALLDNPALTLPGNPGVWSGDAPRFRVASDGQDYLIMWMESEGNSLDPTKVLLTRVRGADGAVLDQTPLMLGPAAPGVRNPSLAFAGTHYVAAWSQYEGNSSWVWTRRVNREGIAVDPARSVLYESTSSNHFTRVAPFGDTVAILWGGSKVRGSRVRTSDGALLDSAGPFTLSSSFGFNSFGTLLAAAADGEHLIALWQQWAFLPTPVPAHIRLGRVTPGGVLLDPDGTIVASSPDWHIYDPAVSASSSGHVLAAHVRFDPDPARASDRLHLRWFGAAFPAPPPPDAAPADAALADAAAPPLDAGVSPADAEAPPADAVLSPGDALTADGPASPSDVPGADVAHDQDGASADALGADGRTVDASAGVDAVAPDGSSPVADGSSSSADATAATDALALRDGSADGPATQPPPGCDCQLGGGTAPPNALPALLGAGVLLLMTRRRRPRGGPSRAAGSRRTVE